MSLESLGFLVILSNPDPLSFLDCLEILDRLAIRSHQADLSDQEILDCLQIRASLVHR